MVSCESILELAHQSRGYSPCFAGIAHRLPEGTQRNQHCSICNGHTNNGGLGTAKGHGRDTRGHRAAGFTGVSCAGKHFPRRYSLNHVMFLHRNAFSASNSAQPQGCNARIFREGSEASMERATTVDQKKIAGFRLRFSIHRCIRPNVSRGPAISRTTPWRYGTCATTANLRPNCSVPSSG